MTESSTPPPPPPDASADEIEADIAATRERLAESVDALADKVNVKAQAGRKVEETKEQAKAKVGEATARAQAAAGEAKGQAQQLVDQAKTAPRPLQVAIVLIPVTVIVLLIVKAVRGRRS
jgi:hypothetical protein